MKSETSSPPKESTVTEVNKAADLVSYHNDSITSRVIVKRPSGSVTIFAFNEGQGLGEHTVPFDALVQILEGEAEICIAGQRHRLQGGELILMPANQPHALKAVKRFKMVLTKIQS